MKKLLALLTTATLVGGVLSTATVSAQEAPPAPPIPETPNILDVANDGNFLNDQGNRGQTGFQGDNATPADGSTVGDMLKVWFTHDAESVYIHYLTQAAPPASTSINFQAFTSPGEGSAGSSSIGCLRWVALIPGQAQGAPTTYQGPPVIKLIDRCNDGANVFNNGVEGEWSAVAVEGQGGVLTVKFPRSYSPLLADGQSLTTPYAETILVWGADGAGFLGAPMIDNTNFGTDYALTGGGPVVEPPPVDPPKVDPPVKKGCKKGKGKKKGCKKPACPTFTPGEAGAEAETTVVTDKATEEAPIEIPVPTEAGLPVASSHLFHNLQVDSKAKSAGLYVRYEFEPYEDLDLYLYNADGTTAAQAAGFNPFPFIPNNAVFFTDGTGTGGHSEMGAEQVDGALTPDCGGYTADLAQYLAEGGERVLKVWLGPATWDPVAQAPIEQEDEG